MTLSGLTANSIKEMSNDEIAMQLRSLRALIKIRSGNQESTQQEELDFCYLTREMEDRVRLERLNSLGRNFS